MQAVIDKVRQRVSPEDFIQFRQQSGLFVRGEASAQAFHSQVVSLGLAALLPDLAALCPDPTKRTDLLEVHKTTFAKGGGTKVPHAMSLDWVIWVTNSKVYLGSNLCSRHSMPFNYCSIVC